MQRPLSQEPEDGVFEGFTLRAHSKPPFLSLLLGLGAYIEYIEYMPFPIYRIVT